MIALLLAAAIGQVEDIADFHERWRIAESEYSDELSRYNKSDRVAMTNRPKHSPNDDSNAQFYAFFQHVLQRKHEEHG